MFILRRLFRYAVWAALGATLTYFGGGKGAFAFIFGYVVLAYLLWRAWPAVRRDFSLLGELRPKGKYRGNSGRVSL